MPLSTGLTASFILSHYYHVTGFFAALFFTGTLLAPINAAMTTIYVAYAENPEALKVSMDAFGMRMVRSTHFLFTISQRSPSGALRRIDGRRFTAGYDDVTSQPHHEDGIVQEKSTKGVEPVAKTVVSVA